MQNANEVIFHLILNLIVGRGAFGSLVYDYNVPRYGADSFFFYKFGYNLIFKIPN